MRKTLFVFIVLLCMQVGFSYALDDCSELGEDYTAVKEQVTTKMDQWKALRESDKNKAIQGKILSDLLAK